MTSHAILRFRDSWAILNISCFKYPHVSKWTKAYQKPEKTFTTAIALHCTEVAGLAFFHNDYLHKITAAALHLVVCIFPDKISMHSINFHNIFLVEMSCYKDTIKFLIKSFFLGSFLCKGRRMKKLAGIFSLVY